MATDQRGRVRAERSPKRLRAYLGGELVLDTRRPLLVWEIPYYPAYYVPAGDVVAELTDTGEVDHSPSRGDAAVLTVCTPGHRAEGAALRYDDSPLDALAGHVRFDWAALDAWFEEDEEVFTHPRSPYARVDILPTSRQVVVRRRGVPLARSDRAHAVFETGLPPRWYVPRTDVRMDLLRPSGTVTNCPYKGRASHFHAHLAGEVVEDVAWSYPTPLPESQRLAGLVAFYDDRVTVEVDGVVQGGGEP
ncbi:MAG TPA: DUF427 domain-containing protein [Acidimicrobiales bacterium]|nr:DUF427 domain-containing protein [Acidimicrobiales bacterium]